MIVGIDEVGRGPLAGPVVSCALYFTNNSVRDKVIAAGLNDSKQVTPELRQDLMFMMAPGAVWQLGWRDNNFIDKKNILVSTKSSMEDALMLLLHPETSAEIIIDGNFTLGLGNSHWQERCVIKADSQYPEVMAASIVAKVFRDEYMKLLDKEYPMYGWCRNKGYGTAQHRSAISTHGITPHHRETFCVKFIPTVSSLSKCN